MKFFCFLFLIFSVESFGQTFLNEDNALLMVLRTEDNFIASENFEVYRSDNRWYIPLSAWADALKVAIKVSAQLGKAEGFFIREDFDFKLDTKLCKVTIKGKAFDYLCDQVILNSDEIFVSSLLLESWFPIRMNFDTYNSSITVTSEMKFPDQEKRAREKKSLGITNQNEKLPVGYVFQPNQEQPFGAPILDQKFNFQTDKKDLRPLFTSDSVVATEIYGWQTSLGLRANQEKFDDTNLNLTQREYEGTLLGPLKAREIQLVDLTSFQVPMIANARRGVGVMVSNLKNSQSLNFSTHTFIGRIPTGWDVELYQNNLLLARRFSNSDSNYEFRDVLLFYGVNYFKFVFYGPQGQKEEKMEVINIGPKMVTPGEFNYQLLVSGDKYNSKNYFTSEQFTYGINENLSLGVTHALALPGSIESESPIHFSGLQSLASVGPLLASLNLAGNEESGSAAELQFKVPFQRGFFSFAETRLDGFRSGVFAPRAGVFQTKNQQISTGFMPFAGFNFRLSAELTQKLYTDNFEELSFVQRSNIRFLGIDWANNLKWQDRAEKIPDGELNIFSSYRKYEFKHLLEYKDTIKRYGLTIDYRAHPKTTFQLARTETIESSSDQKSQWQFGVNKALESCLLGLTTSYASDNSFQISASVSFSVLQNPIARNLQFDPDPQTMNGSAVAHVFRDRNSSGVFDEGDESMQGVEINVDQNNFKAITDSQGEVFIPKLPAGQNIDLSVALKSLSDPFLSPEKKGIRIIPKAGNIARLEFPIIYQVDIEGFVTAVQIDKTTNKAQRKGKKNVRLELRSPEGLVFFTKKSDEEGYYHFSELKSGAYRLTLSQDQKGQDSYHKKIRTSPEYIDFFIKDDGPSTNNFDFEIIE